MKTKTIFLWLLLALLVGGANSALAFRYVITWYDGTEHQYRNDGGSGSFFTTSGDINNNNKFANQEKKPTYTDDTYGQFTFSHGLKMQMTTSLDFTLTGASTLTILKSTYSKGDDISSYTIKLHNNTTGNDVGTYVGTDTGNGYQEIRIEGLTAGSYSIKRDNGESGLLYVRVTDDASMTMAVHETDLMYGAYNGDGARIKVTDEFAYVEPSTYSYSGNTWLRIKVNFSKALNAVSEVTLKSSNTSVLATDDASKNYIINNTDNLAAYYFVKVVGYSSDPVTITFTHTATSSTTSKSFTVNPGTMNTYSSYPYKWDFQNYEWTSTRLQLGTTSGSAWTTTNNYSVINQGIITGVTSNLNMIKSLAFETAAGDLTLDWTNKKVSLAAGSKIRIPGDLSGRVVTFNASGEFAWDSEGTVTKMGANKFYVSSGTGVIFSNASAVDIYSIDVSDTGLATYETTSAGVFQFTGNGTLAGGTVIKDVPGIEMTIGNGGTWNVNDVTDSNVTLKCATYSTATSADAILVFRPIVNGYLTLKGKFYGGNGQNTRLYLNGSDNSSVTVLDNTVHYVSGGDLVISTPLKAGVTYTLTNGTHYNNEFHGFSFEPAFLNTAGTGRQSAENPAVFAAMGSTTVFPSILTDANEYVTFAATGGAPNGAITVEANGNGTPTLVAPTASAYTITATIASPNSSVASKTASYQLSYTATAVTLEFAWSSPCNTNYVENGTYKNVVTAKAGDTDVTDDMETWTYTSSDPSIATVASGGTVTILNSGTIEITVTATDTQGVYQSATSSYWLTINPTTTPTLSLSNGTDSKTITYGQETYTNVGTLLDVSGPTVTYASSDPTIATVNNSGVVTPVKPSATPVTITVTSSQYKQYASVSQTYQVTVAKGTLTMRFIPESVILNQGEKITPYINFSTVNKVGVDNKFTVTTSNAAIAILNNPTYETHEKDEGGVAKVDAIDVEITAGTTSGTAVVTVTMSGSDYYNDVTTSCNVLVRATSQKNFSWASKQEVPVYTIYQGDFMMVPAIEGNCSQNDSYSLASNMKYAKKIKYDQSANMEDSKNYRPKEGVPDYLIVDADESGNAPAAGAANSNTYAWILYARSENDRTSAYPDSLMVYGKISDNNEHIVYLRAQDPNNTSYYCDAKIVIKPKSDLDSKFSTDVSGMSYPFTWDFTSLSNDDMTLIANDNVYYEARSKVNKNYEGYHLSTGFFNSQDSYVIKDGDNYRKTPSVEKPNNLYFQNFVVQDGNGGLKTLKPFKGLKVSMAQTRYNSKVDRVRIFNDHLYFNGGPTEIQLPSVASMPSSFKVFVKLKSNGSRTMYFKQGSGAKVSQSLSGSDEVVSFEATSADGVITLQFQDCNVYWIACSTEEKPVNIHPTSSKAVATYSYAQDLDFDKSLEANNGLVTGSNLKAYYVSEYGTNSVTLTQVPKGGTKSNQGLILKSEKTVNGNYFMVANPRNVDTYSELANINATNYLVGTSDKVGQTISSQETVENVTYTNFLLSKKYTRYKEDFETVIQADVPTSDWAFYRLHSTTPKAPASMAYLHLPVDNFNHYGARSQVNNLSNESKTTIDELLYLTFVDRDGNVETTAINSINNEDSGIADDDAWYNLQGVRVNVLKSGSIYLHKGKKVYVK